MRISVRSPINQAANLEPLAFLGHPSRPKRGRNDRALRWRQLLLRANRTQESRLGPSMCRRENSP
jgi:hypothetical protein